MGEENQGDESCASRAWVRAEVQRQMEPLSKALAEIKGQNETQTTILSKHVGMVGDFDKRFRALWGNGSGPPGYLEVARAEDKARFTRLEELVRGLEANGYREEGKKLFRKEQAEDRTRWLRNAKLWIGIVSALAGLGFHSVLVPLFHFLGSLAK